MTIDELCAEIKNIENRYRNRIIELEEQLLSAKMPIKPDAEERNTISKDEYYDLMWELEGYPDVVADIMKCYKVTTLVNLPKDELRNVKTKIRTIKKNYEDYLATNENKGQ